MENVLIYRNGAYYQTRVNAYKRYLKTFKPLEEFIADLYGEYYKPLTAKDFK